jgi:outer membrane protein
MKHITPLLIAAFTCTHALAVDELQLGLVGFADSKPYRSVKDDVQLFPFVKARYGAFYLEGLDMGAMLWEQEQFALKAGVSYGTYGYKANDGKYLQGMRTKQPSIDGDIEAVVPLTETSYVSARLSHDISSKHKGYSSILRYDKQLLQSSDYQVGVYAKAEYLSEKKTAYYYGVSPAEATLSRKAYTAGDALNVATGLACAYSVTPQWTLLGGVEYIRLDKEIYRSPIVEDREEVSGYVGLMYRFL